MSSADSAGGGAAGGGRYVDRTHTLSDDSSDEENSNSDRYSKRAKKYTKMTIVDKDENPAKFEQTTTELEYKMVKGEINKKIHLKLFPPNNNFDQYWHPVEIGDFENFQDLILNMIKVPEELWKDILNPNAVVGALYGANGSDEAFFTLYLPFVEDRVFDVQFGSKSTIMRKVLLNVERKLDYKHIIENCLRYMVRHNTASINMENQHFLSQLLVKDTLNYELLQLKDHPKYSSVYRKYQSDKKVMLNKALVAFADYFYRHFLNRYFSLGTYVSQETYPVHSTTLRRDVLQEKNKCVYILKLHYTFKLPDWKTKVLDSLLDVEFENGQFNAGAD